MGTYATAAELDDYLTDDDLIQTPLDPEQAERVLLDSERDVDRLLVLGDRDPETGLRLSVEALSEPQRAALSRATCAAAVWRLYSEPEDLAGADDGVVSVPGISLRPPTRPPGPRPIEELAAHGFPLRSGTVAAEPEDGRS